MTARNDLLLLTPADLADITNRGTVKRATKELDQDKVSWKLTEDGGTVHAVWSDGPVCTLPAGRTLADGLCDCPAPGICRHLIRTVLVYQAAHEGTATPGATTPWSPGDISDEALQAAYSSRMLTALRTLFDAGIVAEVVRSTKPVARFHKLRHTIRFLVPGDVRYAQCDCTEEAPCRHAALAVWAFRELAEDAASAIVDTEPCQQLPVDVLDYAAGTLRDIVEVGIVNTPTVVMDRLKKAEGQLRTANVIWPAEVLADFRRQYDHYHAHDSRFSPEELSNLIGEFAIRTDALAADSLPIPALFVRGHADDQDAKLGQSRLFGLGCVVRTHRNSAQVLALLQDDSTGMVVAVARHFPDPTDQDALPEDFSRLATKLVVKGRDLATIGAGQLVIKTGKLYSDHRLSLGRSDTSVYAQKYAWEDLRAPVHAESFAEIRARLAHLPPASLRPRRVGEDTHVVQIAEVRHVRFSSRDHAIHAVLLDESGEEAELRHPFSTRNRHGTERALNWLMTKPDHLLFVAGSFRLSASGLRIAPTGLVFDGPERTLVQPWVDDMDAHLETAQVSISATEAAVRPLDKLRADLTNELGDAVLSGNEMLFTSQASRWEGIEKLAVDLKLRSVARGVSELRAAIVTRDAAQTSDSLLRLSVLSKLAQELG